ncbi:MAG: hypothetical protein HY706_20675, partial [Candidatus Hydrogenedentes bacterium]|nr:hypothetical protein [Candidatus Hydrogenedentota bacterium]
TTATVAVEESGNHYLGIQGEAGDGMATLYSVPTRNQARRGYLLGARVKSLGAKGYFGFECMDDRELIAFGSNIVNQITSPDWTWVSGFFRSQLHWEALRVTLGIYKDTGATGYDGVFLVELSEPQ